MILYIILGIILFIISLFLYIRLKFKFWSYQPVFHYLNLLYWIHPPGIIQSKLPTLNKFCNLQNIEYIKFSSISELKTTKMVSFIQQHYLQTKNTHYNPLCS